MEPFQAENTMEQRLILRAARRGLPLTGTLELTPLCNMNCGMCYVRMSRREQEGKAPLRSWQEWLRLGEEMAKAGTLFLLLTGGEPLLFPGFRELYLGLRRLGFILTINTNGTLLDSDWADFFAEYQPRRVNITLYGAGAGTYGRLCGLSEGYELALRAVRLLRERGVAVKLNGSAARPNAAELGELYRTGRALGVPVHVDAYMLPGRRERFLSPEEQTRLGPEEAAAVQMLVWRSEMPEERFAAFLRRTLEEIDRPEHDYPRGLTCQAACSSFAVHWQGNLCPCVSLQSPAVPVFETGFADGWARLLEEKASLVTHPDCAACPLRSICQTCAASAWWEAGSPGGLPSYCCRMAHELERLLRREGAAQVAQTAK